MPFYVMIKEIQYVNIREVLSRALRHPYLQSMTLEEAIQHTIDFIGIVGVPDFYVTKEAVVEIHDFRAPLPCDLISIDLVKHHGRAMRSMTDVFLTNESKDRHHGHHHPRYHCHDLNEETFKTQGNVIYTSFKEGHVEIAYKAIMVDEEGYPLLPDNANFLAALTEYIKLEAFTVLFDRNKISQQVFANQQQRYAWRVGQVTSEFTIPSMSEMEAITRMWNTLIPRTTEFNNGFRDLGNREYIRRH